MTKTNGIPMDVTNKSPMDFPRNASKQGLLLVLLLKKKSHGKLCDESVTPTQFLPTLPLLPPSPPSVPRFGVELCLWVPQHHDPLPARIQHPHTLHPASPPSFTNYLAHPRVAPTHSSTPISHCLYGTHTLFHSLSTNGAQLHQDTFDKKRSSAIADA
ncbi:uncharacterized protein LACBIDRAFT_333602 [Laccaria bicolor S238N-H82]|uniref:Predicted protein n=1 Tax=Laccaria bicolor (strain S238N-H82 / ATCC MYA-4686) TaxID=486041 RepID=B0DWH1_LACBS|nr:uncharacterized protein LACBIDRAFT_333602 [Laccaria bicolor S238N-H82]EDR01089.1 predicted protein [Laccaria bicolor S238N-H82]|eukprot:XP_001888308.1 predicted protein [Laccaria bicolor S238N-H82]